MVTARTFRAREHQERNRGFARAMRHVPSEAEQKFWRRVRNRQLGGHKFKRQVLMGAYIADYVCIERKLVVELDGEQHSNQKGYDRKRHEFLRQEGYRVVRILNVDLRENLDGVLDRLLELLDGSPSP